jgi:hypothetical protein
MFEEVELVVDKSSVKFANAVRMPEKIGSGVRQVIAGTVGDVVRNLDLFHLIPVDGMRAEIARDG